VPIKRPDRQWWVRVHPSPDACLTPVALLELKDEGEKYAVLPNIARELANECSFVSLHLAMNRQGVAFLWCTRLPGPDGKLLEWHRSGAEAAELAKKEWIRLIANKSLGAYEILQAPAGYPEPTWPDLPFPDIFRIALRDRTIDSLDHPVVKQLRGEA
jgi:hypothetical protein